MINDIQALMVALDNEDALIRQQARQELLAMQDQSEVILALRKTMSSNTKRSYWEAAKTLAELADLSTIPDFEAALDGENLILAQIAVRALSTMQAYDVLVDKLPQLNPLLQVHIINAMIQDEYDLQAWHILVDLVEHSEHDSVRYLAIEALGKLRIYEAKSLITAYADSDNHHIRERVEIALNYLTD